MLTHLQVSNYALIRNHESDFGKSLTVITGETGAGKSILLGALGLVLGKRADKKVLLDPSGKCVVEARFSIERYGLERFFEEHDLDWEAETILRREITSSGRSRAFVNDTPVLLETLNALGLQLVHIHSQHETLDLAQSRFQISVLDTLAGNANLLGQYRAAFAELNARKLELKTRRDAYEQILADRDYLQFQFDELEKAGLDGLDQTALEEEVQVLSNAESIKKGLLEGLQKLREQPQSSIDMLSEISASLDAVARWQPAAQNLAERLESIRIEAEDIASEMERLERETQYDESRIGELTDQLDALNRLLAKHRFNDASELNAFKEELENKLLSIDTESHDLSELEAIVESAGKEVTRLAEKLTKARKKAVSPFVKKVNALLEDVGMPGASLEVEISPMEEAGLTGADKVRFLFASNAGTKPSSLRQVASGGELSRLMLCIKSLLASKSQMPTLIFDEIDTGVSGETGLRIGKLMEELASDHQIIAITHLPQIAAAGEHHLFVYKQQSGKKVESMIRSLEESERVEQIARMISGDTPSEAARRNARELLGQA